MKVNKTQYNFYVERKLPKLGDLVVERKTSVHKVINTKVSYDPFNMKRKGTKRHNDYNILRLSYSNYKRGLKTKEEFLYILLKSKYLCKYVNKFKLSESITL